MYTYLNISGGGSGGSGGAGGGGGGRKCSSNFSDNSLSAKIVQMG